MLAAPRSPRTTFTNRQVCEFYFRPCRPVRRGDSQVLSLPVRLGSEASRYSNLMQLIRREHPVFDEEMLAATPGETGSLVHYVRHSAQNLFGWLEWLVKCNLPLSFCESELARRYDPVSSNMYRLRLAADI
ncbi:uncharacterized protein IUM83_04639 [Phytophthora cinnamomi]|uniref:uncharacterized protein n=1 Tax=Phytophthora cinnamomi TaxID=4785 RepID=UPI00355A0B28|nr:hypothetical protein IUM83_04639 [Phytophthora cinnamomi]